MGALPNRDSVWIAVRFSHFVNFPPEVLSSFRYLISSHLIEDIGEIFVHRFCACYSSLLYPVYLNFFVTNLSGQQRDLQLYVESEPHRGLKFYHQKYNPLTPWWNERRSNPRLSGRERATKGFGDLILSLQELVFISTLFKVIHFLPSQRTINAS